MVLQLAALLFWFVLSKKISSDEPTAHYLSVIKRHTDRLRHCEKAAITVNTAEHLKSQIFSSEVVGVQDRAKRE